MPEETLIVRGAREHNLRNVDVTIPRDQLTVITGLSGSGKSSLAFDTIYAEGQRRYVESLSAYARQFLGLMEKPDVDSIEGLSPAISIEQKTAGHNPRSTVGTVTEIYDYLRLLYARAGTPHCPNCGRARAAPERGADRRHGAHAGPTDTRIEVLAPLVRGRKGEFSELFEIGAQAGLRARDRRRRARSSSRSRRSSTSSRTTASRSSSTGSSCAPKIAAGSPIRSRPRSSSPTASSKSRATTTGATQLFSEHYGCPTCGISLPELEPRQFSFNSPFGACPTLRRTRHAARSQRRAHPRRREHLDSRGRHPPVGRARAAICARRSFPALAQAVQVRSQRAVGRALAEDARDSCCTARRGRRRSSASKQATRGDVESAWEGVLANVQRRYNETESDAVRDGARGVHDRGAVHRVRRPPAQARVARGHDRRT